MLQDTIAGISTAMGEGAISIIRLSGDEALDIANKIFRGKDLKSVASHTINYGFIFQSCEHQKHLRLKISWKLTATGEF